MMRAFLRLPTSILFLLLSSRNTIATRSGSRLEGDNSDKIRCHDVQRSGGHNGINTTLQRRQAQAQLRKGAAPTAMRKMSADEDEMFFPEYWGFQQIQSDMELEGNCTHTIDQFEELLAPMAVHVQSRSDDDGILKRSLDHNMPSFLNIFKRASCPLGTNSCTNIGYPNSCCSSSQTCILIADTGLGPVGCCPAGSTCSGSISSCAAGNTACPSSLGGGCCIPGYTCSGVGCEFSSYICTYIHLQLHTNRRQAFRV